MDLRRNPGLPSRLAKAFADLVAIETVAEFRAFRVDDLMHRGSLTLPLPGSTPWARAAWMLSDGMRISDISLRWNGGRHETWATIERPRRRLRVTGVVENAVRGFLQL